MGILNFLFGNGEQDSGEERGYGDLTDTERSLLDEADTYYAAELEGAAYDANVFFHADADEGAVYILENQGDEYNATFSYSDQDTGDNDLLTHLNGSWGR